MANTVGDAGGPRTFLAVLGAVVTVILRAPTPVLAEPRVCRFIVGDEELNALSGRCDAGDILVGVVEERLGSLLGYAARLCDVSQQIVTYRNPEPGRSQAVFTCVFTGSVLGSVSA
jgi:hypothetical protein